MPQQYPHIFSKGKIGNLDLKNRVVMTAMANGLANPDGTPSDKMIRYYEERAKGGVGLIVTEIARINDDNGIGEENQLSVTRDEHIEPLRKMAESIHQYGTKIFVQVQHPGRQTYSAMIGGQPVVAPSAIPCKVCQQETRALTTDEVGVLVEEFIAGAKRIKASGIDGVELHAAHGYLINQFLSPYTNKRTDKYGGSFENRLRFLKEIIGGIRKECGDFPLMVRLSVDEFLPSVGITERGIDLKEGIRIVKALAKSGIDAINISCGIYETMNTSLEPISYPQGWKTHLSKAVKSVVKIPVIAVNVIRKPEFAEELLRSNVLDFIGIGRGLLADPEWAIKAEEGREDEIRYCVSCLHCFENIFSGKVECALNPRTTRELEFDHLKVNGEGKTVAIIGAGPAGMESARILAMRGFKPIIFEKESVVGGQLQLANKPPHKEKITWLIENMQSQLHKLGVEIRLNTEATVDELKKLDPYAVFIATGADVIIPSIKGVGRENVYTVPQILMGEARLTDETVAVIGSGMTGLETAEFLAERGNKVTVFEMLDTIGPGVYMQNLLDVTTRLRKLGVQMLPGHELQEIAAEKIILKKEDNQKTVEFPLDAVVLSLGVKSNNKIAHTIKNNFSNVKIIGDAKEPRKFAQAIKEGFEEAYFLEIKETIMA